MRISLLTSSLALVSSLGGALGAATGPNLFSRQSGRTSPLLTVFPGQGALPTLADIINLNATNGTFLPLQNIQADIFIGMKKPREAFLFFTISNAAGFKTALKNNVAALVTSTATILSPPASQPLAFLNIAFSQSGLNALGITDNLGDSLFSAGQLADAPSLGDVTTEWDPTFLTPVHGVLLVGSDQQTYIDDLINTVLGFFGSSITEKSRLQGAARPGFQAGHEHFGFLDGISNPAISGFSIFGLPGQSIVPTGTILTNRVGDLALRPLWTLDGSFLVFRKLKQLVPEFNQFLAQNPVQNAARTLTPAQGAELLGARMVGRWRSGAPVDLASTADDPSLGADPQRNNNFDYSHFGSNPLTDQSHCPFSAHIRKTRPRSDLANVDTVNQAIRAGIPYGPEVTASENSTHVTSQERGLAFVEYQSSIANGFRFQQVNWANTAAFAPLKSPTPGIEPIIGQVGGDGARTMTGLDPQNFTRQWTIPQFVKSAGGEYFFSPSIPALLNKIAV